ncbi:unnamed protein product [Durusdinium trenchii]|uniref:RNA pseudouridine synthase n=2 Tax=Durusdinium trenchii TaxID=1381693 RepID=A0ABP0J081_9DINO
MACHKVTVGGWPAALLVLERRGDSSPTVRTDALSPACTARERRDEREPQDCVLVHHLPAQAPAQPLMDLLLNLWPSHFPTVSVARRVCARARVWIKEVKEMRDTSVRQAWWSESLAAPQTIVFLPDYPRRSPHETKLEVLFEDEHLAVVVKEPGLRLHGGVRTLANMLAAKEQPSLSPSMQEDALASAIPLHFLEAEIGGLVLCAKTATAAALSARGESAGYSLRRRFRGIFCGMVEGSERGML